MKFANHPLILDLYIGGIYKSINIWYPLAIENKANPQTCHKFIHNQL